MSVPANPEDWMVVYAMAYVQEKPGVRACKRTYARAVGVRIEDAEEHERACEGHACDMHTQSRASTHMCVSEHALFVSTCVQTVRTPFSCRIML